VRGRLAAAILAYVLAVLAIFPVTIDRAAADTVPATPGGWQRVFTDGFDTDSRVFPTVGWNAYPPTYHDTSGHGHYDCVTACSVSGGLLRLHLHGDTVAAPTPKLPVLTEGRYSVRFQIANATPNTYKIAWLLWPDDPQGGATAKDGEIDFPETNSVPGAISGYVHPTNPSGNGDQQAFRAFATTATWHTATIERRTGSVRFFLDGAPVGEATGPRLPTKPMHWVLQSETRLEATASPPSSAFADVLIDWVTVDAVGGPPEPAPAPGPAPTPAPRAAPEVAADLTHFHCPL
jgi:hypothetical protein